jgi:hypothetical protein
LQLFIAADKAQARRFLLHVLSNDEIGESLEQLSDDWRDVVIVCFIEQVSQFVLCV